MTMKQKKRCKKKRKENERVWGYEGNGYMHLYSLDNNQYQVILLFYSIAAHHLKFLVMVMSTCIVSGKKPIITTRLVLNENKL